MIYSLKFKHTLSSVALLMLANVLTFPFAMRGQSLELSDPELHRYLQNNEHPKPFSEDTLRDVDLQLLPGPFDCNRLRPLRQVQYLTLPYWVTDIGPLSDSSYAQLLSLNASGTKLTEKAFGRMVLPQLQVLNIAESNVVGLDFLNRFPRLQTLIIAQAQADTPEILAYQRSHPSVAIRYQGRIRRLARNCGHAELSAQLAEKMIYPAVKPTESKRIDIRFVIQANGRVRLANVLQGYTQEADAAALRAVYTLHFEVSETETIRTAYIYLRSN
jgi:hypothetical protein